MMTILRRLFGDEYPDRNETWTEYMDRDKKWFRNHFLVPALATVAVVLVLTLLAEAIERGIA